MCSRLLAHARENSGRIHLGWLLQNWRCRQNRRAGYVTIVGAAKPVISGGYNVYPAEVEAISTSCRRVESRGCVPHADFGEVGVAVVVAKRVWR